MKKITSLNKGIKVLKRLAKEPYEMSAIELSQDLDLNRSTVHRLLNNLIEEELVEQNVKNKKYKLSSFVHKMAVEYIKGQKFLSTNC